MSEPVFDPFAAGEVALTVPTTAPQQEIWLAVRMNEGDARLAYNESLSVELSGPLDREALKRAIHALAERHEALRTTFTADGETGCVNAQPNYEWRVDDLSPLQQEEKEARQHAIVKEETGADFDLEAGPLFRPRLVVLDAEHHELILTAHHLICDGWSAGVLVTELPALYAATISGDTPKLPEAPKFSDYALSSWQDREDTAEHEQYWFELLGSSPPVLDLPADHPRPPLRELGAGREDRLLDAELLGALKKTASSLGASLASLMLAAFDALLFRHTGQSDFVIAMPMAGQAEAGLHALVGHCVNTVPLLVGFDPEAPFADHVRAVKNAILDGTEHQRISLGELVRKLELPRDSSRVPLTPVIFNCDPKMDLVTLGDARATAYRTNPRQAEYFELYLNCTETDSGLALEATFGAALFEPHTIKDWLAEYETLLRSVTENSQTPLGRLLLLPEEAERHLLEDLNQTARPVETHSVLELFEAQARATPQNVAVRDLHRALSYSELDARANHLAHELQKLGVSRGDTVGVCLSRSALICPALLATWKAGAAYVPLDPEYPEERLAFLVRDSELKALIIERSLVDVMSGRAVANLVVDEIEGEREEPPERGLEPSDTAYIIHTSGSTGTPKGVEVEHASFANLMASLKAWPGLDAGDVLVAVTTFSFDMAGVELFFPLCVGAQVVVADRDTTMDARLLAALLRESGATAMQATPVTWRLLSDGGWEGASPFKAITGGEPLAPDLADALLARVSELWNLYGPTETTVYATGIRINDPTQITIGGAVANTTAYVLDAYRQLTPRGAFGELHVGGKAVARGYRNRPELTAERFVDDPFTREGSKLYRTGDVVRWDTQGRLEYVGRNDNQIKVRGFRIELGEIEARLTELEEIRQAVVVARELAPGDLRLIGYVLPQAGSIEARSVLGQLEKALPRYLVPQHLVVLDEFPLTPNGKIDKKALPLPGDSPERSTPKTEPATETERQLAAIWKDLLHVAEFGLEDGFFESGGHSMLAIRMLGQVRDHFGVELPMRTVFQAQTVRSLALLIDASTVQQQTEATAREDMEEIEF